MSHMDIIRNPHWHQTWPLNPRCSWWFSKCYLIHLDTFQEQKTKQLVNSLPQLTTSKQRTLAAGLQPGVIVAMGGGASTMGNGRSESKENAGHFGGSGARIQMTGWSFGKSAFWKSSLLLMLLFAIITTCCSISCIGVFQHEFNTSYSTWDTVCNIKQPKQLHLPTTTQKLNIGLLGPWLTATTATTATWKKGDLLGETGGSGVAGAFRGMSDRSA